MRTSHVAALAAALVAFGALAGAAPADDGSPATLTAQQWRDDLHYLATQLPRLHKDAFHTISRDAFERAVSDLDAQIPSLDGDQIALRLYALGALPGDSHTGGNGFPGGTYFPLRLRHYADGLYVESAPAADASLVGGRVVRIGNAQADVLYDSLAPLVPHDAGNPGLLTTIGPVMLASGHVLHGLGATPSADAATYVVRKNGKDVSLALTPSAAFPTLYSRAPVAGWADARDNVPAPLWLQHADEPFWSTYLADRRTFYVQLNAMQNGKDQTLAAFFDDVYRQAAALPLDKFVLDLRMNNGGNNYLTKAVVVAIARLLPIDRRGHLFVITSRATYSAAQNLVNRLEFYTEPIFVGEPTGEHVNSYGDPAPIVLPNSGIRLGASTVWWQDIDERDKRTETDPELAADPTLADYEQGRDTALDAVLHYVPDSLEDDVRAAVARGGFGAGLAAYRAYASDPLHRYVLATMEKRVNTLGYTLLGAKDAAGAVAAFRVNAAANPRSANAYDSLGEGYVALGDRSSAVASYRKALAIKPGLQSSLDALARLGAQQ